MLQLLYISTARQTFSQAQLGELLRISRANNDRVGISGLLLAGEKRFLQVLEGPTQAVQATYDRICADPRHFATVILSKTAIVDRLFGAWAMGFQPVGRAGQIGSVATNVSILIGRIADPIIRAYFSTFADQQAAINSSIPAQAIP